ncbi:phage holin family protein [Oceaniglobus roseus]|uniref:phage holin family protein n=1 Tax=Oceaniglobus roseus TaxID=1737570 RepID=UPI000C7F3387|nr:phage holin family protein [Kandeliimicrobium roseum]
MEPERGTSTATLLSDTVNQATDLFRAELDLARAEVGQQIRGAVAAIGMIVAAAALFLTALNVLAAALTSGVAELGLDPGWAAVVVGAAFGLIGWALLARGMHGLNRATRTPRRTVENIKRDADVVKGT